MADITNKTNIFLQIAGYHDGHVDEYQIIEEMNLGSELECKFSFIKKDIERSHYGDIVYALYLNDTDYFKENELSIKDRLLMQGVVYNGGDGRSLTVYEPSPIFDILKNIFDSATGKITCYSIDTGIYIVDENNKVEKIVAAVNTRTNKVTVAFKQETCHVKDFDVTASIVINKYFMVAIGSDNYVLSAMITNQLFTKLKFKINLNDLGAIINALREKF